MKVWLIQIAEPLPIDDGKQKLLRTGMLAKTLAGRGNNVVWWTSSFDHFRKRQRSDKDTFKDIGRNYRICMMRGIGYKKNVSLSRLIDHYMVAEKFRKLSEKEEKPDVIVASFPSIELGLAAAEYGKKNGIPVILDMRDMWPDIFVDFVPPAIRGVARFFLKPMFNNAHRACSMATAICGITEPFVEWGLKTGSRDKTVLDKSFFMGSVDERPDDNSFKEAGEYWDKMGVRKEEGRPIICFSGSVSWQFDIKTAILAVRKIRSSGTAVKLVICGDGDKLEYYKNIARRDENVVFTGWVNMAKLYVLMRRASAGLDLLPDRYDYLATINNKAVEYFSAGLPIISCPRKGVLYDLLKERRCGLSYDNGDVDGLSVILKYMLCNDADKLSEMSREASELFKEKFMAEKIYAEMAGYIEKVADSFKDRT